MYLTMVNIVYCFQGRVLPTSLESLIKAYLFYILCSETILVDVFGIRYFNIYQNIFPITILFILVDMFKKKYFIKTLFCLMHPKTDTSTKYLQPFLHNSVIFSIRGSYSIINNVNKLYCILLVFTVVFWRCWPKTNFVTLNFCWDHCITNTLA